MYWNFHEMPKSRKDGEIIRSNSYCSGAFLIHILLFTILNYVLEMLYISDKNSEKSWDMLKQINLIKCYLKIMKMSVFDRKNNVKVKQTL